MKISTIVLVLLLGVVVSCSERRPQHPSVGLRIFADGGASGTCGFYMPEITESPPGVRIEVSAKSMGFKGPEHEVLIQWEPDIGARGDFYDLVITADRVTSKRRVAFEGRPIVLLEEPFRVVMENVSFGGAPEGD